MRCSYPALSVVASVSAMSVSLLGQPSIVEAAGPQRSVRSIAATGRSPDLNGDGVVTREDAQILTAALGSRCAREGYDATADLNGDCRVDGQDLVMLRQLLGTTVNTPPVAVADEVVLDEDTAVVVPVLSNDVDADGDALSVTGVTQGTKGAVVLAADGSVVYTPAANEHGTDAFTYTAADGKGGESTATVAVTIVPVNDAPTLVASADVTQGRSPLTVAFQATGADVDGDALTYQWEFGDGSSSTDASPMHVFQDAATYTVVATVSDGFLSATQTITIEVLEPTPVTYSAGTFAGTGLAGEAGEGGPANAAELRFPKQLAARRDGTVFIVDESRLLQVDVGGQLTSIRRHTEGQRGVAITVGSDDELYYVDVDVVGTCGFDGEYATLRVRRMTADATDPVVAVVQRVEGLLGSCATEPSLTVAADGGFYVATPTSLFRIPSGASVPAWEIPAPGMPIRGLAARADGGVVVTGERLVHAVSADGVATVLAGNWNYGYFGDGILATAATLGSVSGVAVDEAGAVTLLDFDFFTFAPRVRRIETSGIIRTVAGGQFGYMGDGDLATSAAFAFLDDAGVARLADGRVLVADVENHRVRVLVPEP